MTRRRARRRGLLLAAGALLAILLAEAFPAGAFPLGPFCDPRSIQDYIQGQGSRSQLPIHYRLWMPSYYAKCRRAIGTILYYGTSDTFASRAMQQRIGYFYGRDVPLTTVEQGLIEFDLPTTTLDSYGLQGRIDNSQHIPMYISALSVAYNLSCVTTPLRLSGEALSLIFSGSIERWNDPLLVRENPALGRCNRAVKLAVRSDESGASSVFKDYLAKRSLIWRPYTLPQLNTTWPPTSNISCKGYGEDGVAGCVASRQGSIGYTSLRAATALGLQQARVDNAAGDFATASLAGCFRAAGATPPPATTQGDWSNVSLTNPTSGYAICAFSYVITWSHVDRAYKSINVSLEQVRNLRDYLTIALSDPVQAKLSAYGQAGLPPAWRSLARAGVNRLSYIEP